MRESNQSLQYLQIMLYTLQSQPPIQNRQRAARTNSILDQAIYKQHLDSNTRTFLLKEFANKQ